MGYNKRPISVNIMLDINDPSFFRSGSIQASYLAAVAWVEAKAMPDVSEWHSLQEWLAVTYEAHLDRLMTIDKELLFTTALYVYSTISTVFSYLDSVIIVDISYKELSDGALLISILYVGEKI